MRTVLVTGASTGIGEACARHFASRGVRVLAGVRKAGDAPPGTEEVLLDVTDAEQIAAAAARVERLDGLVDNAGIVVACPLEFLPLEELRHQLEVNVVGQLAVTQAFLPAVRAARGRIVIIGSIAGRSALPFLGAYAMSKHALEAMADSLRIELAPDGIHVAIVEPGTIATPIWTKPRPLLEQLPSEATERYGARMATFRKFAEKRSANAAPPELVVRAIEHALTAEQPKARYLVARDAKIRAKIERLPVRLRDRIHHEGVARFLRGGYGSAHGRLDDGLPADAPAAPAARGDVLPGQADRHEAPRQELPPLHVPRLLPALPAARGRAEEARARARRPRRDARLEPLPAHGVLPRHPVRRLRPPHAQPAAASRPTSRTSPRTPATRR